MQKKSFIIALTGPSACGKTYITDIIIDFAEELKSKNIEFQPERFRKYTTRSYRENEMIERNLGKKIDVEYVKSIPPDCDFVYRSYGKEYGLKYIDLKKRLENNISPIVVINDVRVVEELKSKFPSQILSLFIFREIINDVETHKNAGKSRGGVTLEDSEKRFKKAESLYRIFIENIFVFDRVILNIPKERTGLQGVDIAKIQVEKIIEGVISGKINLSNIIKKGPKLFIISGNAQSGKDDIVKAANIMGKIQSDPLIKHTTRWQEETDGDEIICKYIPKKDILEQFEKEYFLEKEESKKEFSIEKYIFNDEAECRLKYYAKDEYFRENCTFEEYCKVLFDLERIKNESKIKTSIERFWGNLKEKQDKLKQNNLTKELTSEEFAFLRSKYFEFNENYLDLDEIIRQHYNEIEIEKGKIEQAVPQKNENDSYFIRHEGKDYILYENNNLFGEPLRYGYEIGTFVKNWEKRDKHLVLTASLPNMFKICREKFGVENVKTAYAYSQISQAEHLKYADPASGIAKLQEYDDILRYAYHIINFDYALIYAETSLLNKSGGQKDELVDQMFRLFRVYNDEQIKIRNQLFNFSEPHELNKSLKKQVLIIVGQSGVGKSLLSKKLSITKNYPLLVCSEIGTTLAKEKYGGLSFAECFYLPNLNEYINDLNKYILSCVISNFTCMNASTLVIDGMVSIGALELLKIEGFDVKILLLDTSYELRIERIMKRRYCSRLEAEHEAEIKYFRKKCLGIDKIVKLADYVLDGSKPIDEIVADFPLQEFNLKTKEREVY